MARPRKEIDKKKFENLCACQNTQAEICRALEVTDKTLTAWCKREYDGKPFSEVFAIKRQAGKTSLRAAMFKNAVQMGNQKIQIYLADKMRLFDDVADVSEEEDELSKSLRELGETLRSDD